MKFPWYRQLLRHGAQLGRFFAWYLHHGCAAVGWWVGCAYGAVVQGWRGRKLIHLLHGLPALLVFLVVLVCAIAALLTKRDEYTQGYELQADQALRARNWPQARIVLERLTRDNPDRPQFRFELAKVVWLEGNLPRALSLVRSLAPERGHGYGPAHVFLARWLLNSPWLTPELRLNAEAHLLKALQAQPGDPEAHDQLGKLYVQLERLDRAEQHLLAAYPQRPELGLLLASVARRLGQAEQARNYATAASQFFRTRLENAPEDSAARLNLAEALLLLDDYPTAIEELQHGLTGKNAELYRARLGHAFALWARSLPTETETARGKQLALIEEGLKVEPRSPELLLLLSDTTKIDGPEADKSRALLQSLLAQGQASATLHLVLGTDAYRRQKRDEARLHFEQANRLDPRMSIVANNLAWLLASNGTPEDLPRALEMIDAILAHEPNNAHFRETRGQIYAKLARWQDAVADLEAALPHIANPKTLHQTLADAYRHLGVVDLAERHKQLAERAGPR